MNKENKFFLILIIILFISSCDANNVDDLKNVSSYEKTDNEFHLDKDSIEYKEYMKQKHRFSLNKCELTYNEKPFYVGMSLDEARKLFGKETKNIDHGEFSYVFWREKGFALIVTDLKIEYIHVYLKPLTVQRNISYIDLIDDIDDIDDMDKIIGNKYVVFHNSVLSQEERVQDFIKSTDLVFFENLEVGQYGAAYYKKYKCDNKILSYRLESPIYREQHGSGHLMFSGDWKMEDTSPVDHITISH